MTVFKYYAKNNQTIWWLNVIILDPERSHIVYEYYFVKGREDWLLSWAHQGHKHDWD